MEGPIIGKILKREDKQSANNTGFSNYTILHEDGSKKYYNHFKPEVTFNENDIVELLFEVNGKYNNIKTIVPGTRDFKEPENVKSGGGFAKYEREKPEAVEVVIDNDALDFQNKINAVIKEKNVLFTQTMVSPDKGLVAVIYYKEK